MHPRAGTRSTQRSGIQPQPGRREIGLALLSGALLGAAFLPARLGFLAWGAFVPLLIALDARLRAGARGRALFGLGLAFGLAFYLIGTYWIALLSDVAITVPWLKYPAWLAAGAYLSLFAGLAVWLAGELARRTRFSIAISFPLAWLAVEELRGAGEIGFPWFQPGYSQHDFAAPLQLASLGGVTLVTLWLLLLNALVWSALKGRARARAATGALVTLLLPWAYGGAVLRAAPHAPGTVVALVQGNVAGELKWSGNHQREILETFLTLSDQATRRDPPPTLIIWPETATGSYLRKQLDQAFAVVAFTARSRTPVFSGFADYSFDSSGRERHTNAAGMFLPDGAIGEAYAKRHLVPFGERMPFERLFPWLGKLDLGQAEWTAGTHAVLFESAAGPFSCLVCFESIFPELARGDVRRGARWLVNITNDEWFGNSAALYQHAAMAQFRAVENHVPLARCANTGLTELIDSHGRVTQSLAVFKPGVLIGALDREGPVTPYNRAGDWPGAIAFIGIGLLAIRGLALTGRARGH